MSPLPVFSESLVIHLAMNRQNPVGFRAALQSKTEEAGGKGRPSFSRLQFDRFQTSEKCWAHQLDSKNCRFHWRPALREQGEYLAIETAWNLGDNHWVRYFTFHGHFVQDYFNAVGGFRFSRWNDDNFFIDDYVGHPMMGAISMDIFVQNDPRGMSLEFQNSRVYWHSRLPAFIWSAIYSAEWKLGPVSEASVGNTGGFFYYDKNAHKFTNDTGTVGLVITPVGGWAWSVAEDLVDEHIITRLERKSHNPLYLFSIQFLNPCRGFANLLRFKAPWYRDGRPDPREKDYFTQLDSSKNLAHTKAQIARH